MKWKEVELFDRVMCEPHKILSYIFFSSIYVDSDTGWNDVVANSLFVFEPGGDGVLLPLPL